MTRASPAVRAGPRSVRCRTVCPEASAGAVRPAESHPPESHPPGSHPPESRPAEPRPAESRPAELRLIARRPDCRRLGPSLSPAYSISKITMRNSQTHIQNCTDFRGLLRRPRENAFRSLWPPAARLYRLTPRRGHRVPDPSGPGHPAGYRGFAPVPRVVGRGRCGRR